MIFLEEWIQVQSATPLNPYFISSVVEQPENLFAYIPHLHSGSIIKRF